MKIIKIDLLEMEKMKKYRLHGSAKPSFFMRIDVDPVSFKFENGIFKKVNYFKEISQEEEASQEFDPAHYLTISISIAFSVDKQHKSESRSDFSEKKLIGGKIEFNLHRQITDYNGDVILDIPALKIFWALLSTKEYDILNDTLDLAKKREEECLIETRLKEFPRNNKLLDCELYLDKEKKIYFKAKIEKELKKLTIEITSPEKNRKIILEKKLTNEEIKNIEIVTSDTLTEEVIKKVTKRIVDDGRN